MADSATSSGARWPLRITMSRRPIEAHFNNFNLHCVVSLDEDFNNKQNFIAFNPVSLISDNDSAEVQFLLSHPGIFCAMDCTLSVT